MFSVLTFLLLSPLLGAVLIAFTPSWEVRLIKLQTLLLTLINFIVSLGLWLTFDTSTAKFQFVKHIGWLPFLNTLGRGASLLWGRTLGRGVFSVCIFGLYIVFLSFLNPQ